MQSSIGIPGKAIVSGNIAVLTITIFLALATSKVTCYPIGSTLVYNTASEGTSKNVTFSPFPTISDCDKTEPIAKELLSFDDLRALSSSPNHVREAFDQELNIQPDGIALNKETYYDAVKPAITEQYGFYTYKEVGSYTFTSDEVSSPEEAIIGKKVAVNEGDSTAQISVSIQGRWDETTSYSSSVTAGLTFSSEVAIKGIFRTGGSFSVSVTAGKSETTRAVTSFDTSIKVEVPPKSMVEVSMVGAIETEKLGFTAPIYVNGWFGANFESPIKEHYFWYMTAENVLPKTIGEISGVITNARLFNTKTKIGEAVPI